MLNQATPQVTGDQRLIAFTGGPLWVHPTDFQEDFLHNLNSDVNKDINKEDRNREMFLKDPQGSFVS